MKTKHIILAFAFCLFMAVAVILSKQHSSIIGEHERPLDIIAGSQSNSVPVATNRTELAVMGEANGTTNAIGGEGYFKKVIDPRTGQCAIVGLDRRTITMTDKSGNVLWTVNLANEGAKAGLPVGDVQLQDGDFFEKQPLLYVSAGRVAFTIDIHTGKITGSGMH
jgi:hypothetical protein